MLREWGCGASRILLRQSAQLVLVLRARRFRGARDASARTPTDFLAAIELLVRRMNYAQENFAFALPGGVLPSNVEIPLSNVRQLGPRHLDAPWVDEELDPIVQQLIEAWLRAQMLGRQLVGPTWFQRVDLCDAAC